MGIWADLTEEDYDKSLRFAQAMKVLRSGTNSRAAPTSEEEFFADGIGGKLGECAFSHEFGHEVNWTVYHDGGDRYDFVLDNGDTVDTKAVPVHTNMSYNYHVLANPDELAKDVDHFVQVLVSSDFRRALITGWISMEEFHEKAAERTINTHRVGPHPPFGVLRSDLNTEFPDWFYKTR